MEVVYACCCVTGERSALLTEASESELGGMQTKPDQALVPITIGE